MAERHPCKALRLEYEENVECQTFDWLVARCSRIFLTRVLHPIAVLNCGGSALRSSGMSMAFAPQLCCGYSTWIEVPVSLRGPPVSQAGRPHIQLLSHVPHWHWRPRRYLLPYIMEHSLFRWRNNVTIISKSVPTSNSGIFSWLWSSESHSLSCSLRNY